ncbi:MAG TPA: DUF167 domain-containing protein [Pyrinomonadaceae bacterium]|jgi:hypothetical protein
MLRYTERDGALTFAVRVVARAARSEVAGAHDGALRVRVAAPPVAGAANEELRRTLARAFRVPPRAVEIVAGQTSKNKQVCVAGATARQLLALLD